MSTTLFYGYSLGDSHSDLVPGCPTAKFVYQGIKIMPAFEVHSPLQIPLL